MAVNAVDKIRRTEPSISRLLLQQFAVRCGLVGLIFAISQDRIRMPRRLHDEIAEEQYMAKYLLIESRDPFSSHDVGYYYDLARGLNEAGNRVTLFLVQNGVLAARPSAKTTQLRELIGSGIEILADEFALKERGIAVILDGVQKASIEIVADHLEAGSKTLWH